MDQPKAPMHPYQYPRRAQLLNAALFLAAPLPSIYAFHLFTAHCGEGAAAHAPASSLVDRFICLWGTGTSCQAPQVPPLPQPGKEPAEVAAAVAAHGLPRSPQRGGDGGEVPADAGGGGGPHRCRAGRGPVPLYPHKALYPWCVGPQAELWEDIWGVEWGQLSLTTVRGLCDIGYHRALFLNALLLLNMDLLFWVVGLVQGSFWLIDPYWTVVPPLIGAFAALHPLSSADPARSATVLGLLACWSARLGHSYFRREGWCWGLREDWRYADIRSRRPRSFLVTSVVEVFLLQHAMLFGLCLPVLAAHSGAGPWSHLDTAGVAVCVAGVLVAGAADCQLHFYTRRNAFRKPWEGKRLILDSGLWKYSRHPNYVGEMMWWWGLNLFSVGAGGSSYVWTCVGAAFNTAIMAVVTHLTERRMAAGEGRVAAWEAYRKKTPAWVIF